MQRAAGSNSGKVLILSGLGSWMNDWKVLVRQIRSRDTDMASVFHALEIDKVN